MTERNGYFSLNDTMGDIMKTLRGKLLLMQFGLSLMRSIKKSKGGAMGGKGGMKLGKGVIDMMAGFTILRVSNMIGMIGATITKEQLLKLNRQLNHIKKPNE